MFKEKLKFRQIGLLLKDSFVEFFKDKSFIHGASLAYYTILALVPLLYLSFLSIGKFLGQDKLIEIVADVAQEHIGIEDVSWLVDALHLIDLGKGSLVLQIVGVVMLAFSASAVFSSLRASLNTFFAVEIVSVKRSFLHAIIARSVSFLMLTVVAVVIIVFYFIETAFVSFGSSLLGDYMSVFVIEMIQHSISLLSNTIIFLFVFKYLHDGKVDWTIAFRGSLFTAILLYVGQLFIKYYLTNYFFAAGGGVAGTILVILVWMFYSSQIIFLGAKITMVYARMIGHPIRSRN
jgi:membrane protein